MDMKQWAADVIAAEQKKAFPVLSFPGIQDLGLNVRELISTADNQVRTLKVVADKVDSLASVSFMDLSIEAEAFGCKIEQSDSEVPTVVDSIIDEDTDPDTIVVPGLNEKRVGLAIQTIEAASKQITDRPLFAGMIGPFSLAGRLMNVNEIMLLCYDEPELVQATLEKVTAFLIDFATAFKNAGANGVVIAEPLAGLLEVDLEKVFSAPYVKKIVDAVQDDTFLVVYHNCGNGVVQQIESIVANGAAGYHFGNAINMQDVMEHIPSDRLVAGNVDPARVIRNGNPQTVRETTLALMESCAKYPNFIPSTGCDVPPMSPWENIDAFFDAVNEYYETR